MKSFHLFFIALSIILTAGTGVWGVLNQYVLLGALMFVASGLLILYWAYFASKAEQMHLD